VLDIISTCAKKLWQPMLDNFILFLAAGQGRVLVLAD
jgi:hypothetical protein